MINLDLEGKIFVVEDYDIEIRVWSCGEVWVKNPSDSEPLVVEPDRKLWKELWDGENDEAFLRLLTEECGYDAEDFKDE